MQYILITPPTFYPALIDAQYIGRARKMAIPYTPFQASGASTLPPNQTMSAGQHLTSPNKRFKLLLQTDGNLVLLDNNAIVWIANESQAYSKTLYSKRMREKLQFVVSNSGFLYDPSRKRLWIAESTHSIDKSLWYNSCLFVQDDGNLIIYDQRNGNPCWARFGFVPGRIPKPRERWIRRLPDGKEIFTWEFG